MTYTIYMQDCHILFDDIISLNDQQIYQLELVAVTKTRAQWRNEKKGEKILLEPTQKEHVLFTKELLVANKDAVTLFNTVIFFKSHADMRMKKRMDGSFDYRPPHVEKQLFIIGFIIESKHLHDFAEWKGYPNFTYTFLLVNQTYSDYKITIAFQKYGSQISVITVSNKAIDELTVPISELTDLGDQIREAFFSKLPDKYKV